MFKWCFSGDTIPDFSLAHFQMEIDYLTEQITANLQKLNSLGPAPSILSNFQKAVALTLKPDLVNRIKALPSSNQDAQDWLRVAQNLLDGFACCN